MSDPGSMDRFAAMAGAYVHIPFCASICPYCDFAVVAGKDDLSPRYCEAVVAEIERDEGWRPLSSVYFGGGTPSRVSPELLGRIIVALESRHGIEVGAEVTLEANPEDVDLALANALTGAGFNRISFGAQSFDAGVLADLGRRHDPARIEQAVKDAREAGFENVSLDLIYGTPSETDDSWRKTVEQALASDPDHISCYALTVEPGTPLGRDVNAGAPAPDPDLQADRFEAADRMLAAGGLMRYEVSNWARPGRECVYNSTVWAQGEYVAYGNSAHRFRDGVRSRNLIGLHRYLDAVESFRSPVAGAEPALSGPDGEIDRMFVGLRRTAGISAGPGGQALLDSRDGRRLVDVGLISSDGSRIVVDKPMLTDEVLRAVLDLDITEPAESRSFADNVLAEGD
jgi:putative oxygen-independent coproporphyrinogen III oxidase